MRLCELKRGGPWQLLAYGEGLAQVVVAVATKATRHVTLLFRIEDLGLDSTGDKHSSSSR